MAGIKLEGFQGIIPRVSDRLLPPMSGTTARNTKLLQGELRGFRTPVELEDFTSGPTDPVRRAYRIPNTPNDAFLTFDSRDVDVIRSPLVNDTHDRYFWAGDGAPMMNSGANIKAGQVTGPFLLGIPTPANAPNVAPPAGSDETRAYVYTFVSSFGEEGPPSPPTLATGASTVPWVISAFDGTVPNPSQRDIVEIKIYRTVPGNASTSFFLVDTVAWPVAGNTYDDNETSADVAVNPILESTSFVAPPSDLEGFVVMPNGYLVGWVGRRLVFSQPYRPHAWPAEYELSTEFEIVALGVIGSTLVIGTESQPYFGQGVSPASFTTQKIDAVEPCLSRRGMVSTTAGVLYPSINGLVLANSSGVQVVTRSLATKEEWAGYLPDQLYAAQMGLQYIAFNGPNFGFILDPQEPAAKFIELDGFANVEGIETDRYTGNINLIANNKLLDWDPETTLQRMQWTWQSKMYYLAKPMNFGAARLHFITGTEDFTDEVTAKYLPYDEALFLAISGQPGSLERLNTLNGQALGGSPANNTGLVAGWTEPETRQPLAGSLLVPVNALSFQDNSIRVIITVDHNSGSTKVVFDKVIRTESIFRLPTGFKADLWQIKLIGNTTLYSMQLAETPKQLATV